MCRKVPAAGTLGRPSRLTANRSGGTLRNVLASVLWGMGCFDPYSEVDRQYGEPQPRGPRLRRIARRERPSLKNNLVVTDTTEMYLGPSRVVGSSCFLLCLLFVFQYFYYYLLLPIYTYCYLLLPNTTYYYL